MEEEKIRERILKEITIEDEESWKLARDIFTENTNRLKPGITIEGIYNRVTELKKINKIGSRE